MILKNNKCIIKIKKDEIYTIHSSDNNNYDITLNPQKYERSEEYGVLSISIDLFIKSISIALIGSRYSYEENAILEENILTVLQGDTITQINITDGSLLSHVVFCDYPFNFEIHRTDKGYIIYGEIEIIMLDFNLTKKWSFSGHDIFASIIPERIPFMLKKDRICLYDFLDNYYEIDLNGKLLSFRHPEE